MGNHDGVHIDGYSFHHKCMVDRHGGGVRIFVNSSIKHTSSVFLEIEQPHQRKRIVGVIYRPPETR